MFAQLQSLEQQYEDLTERLGDPNVASNPSTYRKLSKEHADLTPLVEAYRRYQEVMEEIEASQQLLEEDDDEMIELAKEELKSLGEEKEGLESTIRRLLLPKDPNDERNVILEVRAGTGGEEASLFANDLFRMYTRYCEARRWKVDILSMSESASGGLKEIICLLKGDSVYSRLKWESGVHRVQRVPTTESQGRIHTSAATVAILPEADEVEAQIEDKELRIDVFRASGPGGQSVNTTDSAVRITHLPTGLTVSCQDEKSQHKNKAKALKILQARLLEKLQGEADAESSAQRRALVGSGDRSERIRTYNFPQGRVTEHRIGLTVYQLDSIIGGDVDLVIEPLITHFEAEALKSQNGDD